MSSPDATTRCHIALGVQSRLDCAELVPINCVSIRCCDDPTAEIQATARGDKIHFGTGIFSPAAL